jgi:UDP-N-acetylmuramoylalanine--D-glutamate ligase
MNITVIGAGKSGMAAALLAHSNGDQVFLSESKSSESCADAHSTLDNAGIESEFGGNTSRALHNTQLIITSPGVPPYTPIIQEAEARGIPVISELEYAWRQISNPVISITGTNGKTTTTALTAFMLNHGGKKAIAAGNIGTPLSALVKNIDPGTIIVLESSSYQLDRTVDFRPDIGVILNITPDHLSYHGSFQAYCQAKWKTSARQNEDDLLILNADNAESAACSAHTSAQVSYISTSPVQQGAYTSDRHLVLASLQHKEELLMLLDEVRLPGVHNRYNSMAAVLAARAFEVRNENIRDSLMLFSGVEHRLEHIRTLHNVHYVNDSKATNINAAWYALSSYPNPLIWIAGGRGDGNDYSALDALVQANVRTIIAIGEESQAIFSHFCTSTRCIRASSLEEAVQISAAEAHSGDTVLFSPACKSFDMFANYEHRGQVFRQAVLAL